MCASFLRRTPCDELLFRNRNVLRLFGFQGSRAYLSVKQTAKVMQWRDEMTGLPGEQKIFSYIELLFKEPECRHINGIRLKLTCGAYAKVQNSEKFFLNLLTDQGS